MHMSKINVNNLSFGNFGHGGCKGVRRPKLLEVLTSVMGGLRSGGYYCRGQRVGIQEFQAVFQAKFWISGRGWSVDRQEQGPEECGPLSALQLCQLQLHMHLVNAVCIYC